MSRTQYLLSRFNTKAAAMLIGFILACSGIAMMFSGVRGGGSIDLKSPFMTGRLETGEAGLFLILISLFICAFACFIKKPRHSLSVKSGPLEVKWEGVVYAFEEIREFELLLKRLGPARSTVNMSPVPEESKDQRNEHA